MPALYQVENPFTKVLQGVRGASQSLARMGQKTDRKTEVDVGPGQKAMNVAQTGLAGYKMYKTLSSPSALTEAGAEAIPAKWAPPTDVSAAPSMGATQPIASGVAQTPAIPVSELTGPSTIGAAGGQFGGAGVGAMGAGGAAEYGGMSAGMGLGTGGGAGGAAAISGGALGASTAATGTMAAGSLGASAVPAYAGGTMAGGMAGGAGGGMAGGAGGALAASSAGGPIAMAAVAAILIAGQIFGAA